MICRLSGVQCLGRMMLGELRQSACGQLADSFNQNWGKLLAGHLDDLLLSGGDEAFVESKEKMLSRTLCHVGQPVGVHAEGGILAGALRISCDARIVSQSWFAGCKLTAEKQLDSRYLQIDTVLQKLNLVTTQFEKLINGL
jgi:hypothetical protein